MDTRTALKCFYMHLLDFEKTEILEYDTVYWFNIEDRKSSSKSPSPSYSRAGGIDNNGFDNDKQEYMTEEGDHIAYRF